MSNVHLKSDATGGALCGAQAAVASSGEVDEVTCPLCLALIEGRAALHAGVDMIARGISEKLAEAQRDPAVGVVSRLVWEVLRAGRRGGTGRGA